MVLSSQLWNVYSQGLSDVFTFEKKKSTWSVISWALRHLQAMILLQLSTRRQIAWLWRIGMFLVNYSRTSHTLYGIKVLHARPNVTKYQVAQFFVSSTLLCLDCHIFISFYHMFMSSYYMAKLVLGKSVQSDWFFFSRGFAVCTQAVYFCFGAKPTNSKFATRTVKKKMWILSFSIAKLPEKAKKIEILRRFQRWMKKKNILWASSELSWTSGTFDSETKTVITESQEAIDDFINQQKSANTNKKKATDINTLLHYFEANGTLWKMRKLKAYLRPSLTTFHDFLSKFVWTHGGKTEKNKS